MSRIEFSVGFADDLERIVTHLNNHKVNNIHSRIQSIIDALSALEANPLIGRPVRGLKRELLIGRRSRGYVALYKYFEKFDIVFVLALRSQKELGYAPRLND
ncbi:type II toxin-antitoxin system RelE/ParE family toxin [Candidatus Hamiltonella defensa]|uniref:Plasmid stabilization protein n=1 Tax=Candidatus Williamhamiltonella defendens TaxID=138072 RepID=A0AAC9YGD2_9ENTR|nr:type II toxin-antitoxin system RelE/ParE family toxin [Candidatus Hamiltonella defensa]ASV34556.1 plasmid stabilization protein [Candidatus Hamiltonella defensa]AWK17515.1 plasmid stabilization protein [Candidatus Hamiltonella defensa]MBK4362290.1 type II toxin-antitoxin system RelE/ParE family toxin [Candidatus Hamiltonella defensa]